MKKYNIIISIILFLSILFTGFILEGGSLSIVFLDPFLWLSIILPSLILTTSQFNLLNTLKIIINLENKSVEEINNCKNSLHFFGKTLIVYGLLFTLFRLMNALTNLSELNEVINKCAKATSGIVFAYLIKFVLVDFLITRLEVNLDGSTPDIKNLHDSSNLTHLTTPKKWLSVILSTSFLMFFTWKQDISILPILLGFTGWIMVSSGAILGFLTRTKVNRWLTVGNFSLFASIFAMLFGIIHILSSITTPKEIGFGVATIIISSIASLLIYSFTLPFQMEVRRINLTSQSFIVYYPALIGLFLTITIGLIFLALRT